MQHEGQQTEGVNGQIEELRLILEHEQLRTVSYDEAQDVSESLITFFEVLAESSDSQL